MDKYISELRAFLESNPISLPNGESIRIEIVLHNEEYELNVSTGRPVAGPFETEEEAVIALLKLKREKMG